MSKTVLCNCSELKYLKISKQLYLKTRMPKCLNDCKIEFWEDVLLLLDKKDRSKLEILIKVYKKMSQRYPLIFKEFYVEILKLDPNFEFE